MQSGLCAYTLGVLTTAGVESPIYVSRYHVGLKLESSSSFSGPQGCRRNCPGCRAQSSFYYINCTIAKEVDHLYLTMLRYIMSAPSLFTHASAVGRLSYKGRPLTPLLNLSKTFHVQSVKHMLYWPSFYVHRSRPSYPLSVVSAHRPESQVTCCPTAPAGSRWIRTLAHLHGISRRMPVSNLF